MPNIQNEHIILFRIDDNSAHIDSLVRKTRKKILFIWINRRVLKE